MKKIRKWVKTKKGEIHIEVDPKKKWIRKTTLYKLRASFPGSANAFSLHPTSFAPRTINPNATKNVGGKSPTLGTQVGYARKGPQERDASWLHRFSEVGKIALLGHNMGHTWDATWV